MSFKKILACVVVFSLMGGSLLFADSVTEKIKFMINGRPVADGGYIINGKTYVPARLANGIVSFNNRTKNVNLIKPNAHITLFKGNTVFGNVNVGKLKFNILVQVDSLSTNINAIKVTITDPKGHVKDIQYQGMGSNRSDNFWFRTYDFTYHFKTAGKYRVGFYMKQSRNSKYALISEKVITAIK
ncbi:copper amine oxidase [Paenibacillus sediminis]|uniref:Copper amine oxidase n=1 Tax=Paenibacillus sediminis TaxID=664909 RepID=A0ABS4GZ28_9BACL|nr:copper amine oxidase [Paenibacillus sediminis]MBP1935521.1 hypothetical protein [Paenibacillus sediminis]